MLQKVRDAGAPDFLVDRPDAIKNRAGDDGSLVMFEHEKGEAVREMVLFYVEPERYFGFGGRGEKYRGKE